MEKFNYNIQFIVANISNKLNIVIIYALLMLMRREKKC